MPVVTFTTDWGTSDFYAGALKGAILSRLPQTVMVDISHNISRDDEAEAAFAVRNAYAHFPKGSIHVIGVSSELPNNDNLLLMESDNHYFISANNSCLSLLFMQPTSVVSVTSTKRVAGFSMLGAIPHLIHQLLQGVQVKDLGTPVQLPESTPIEPVVNRKPTGEVMGIVGHVLHIDAHGNVITNITRALYDEHVQGRGCTVLLNSTRYKVPQIFSTYTDVESGMAVAFFNSLELLEVANAHGNASHLYRLDKKSTITILFNN